MYQSIASKMARVAENRLENAQTPMQMAYAAVMVLLAICKNLEYLVIAHEVQVGDIAKVVDKAVLDDARKQAADED